MLKNIDKLKKQLLGITKKKNECEQQITYLEDVLCNTFGENIDLIYNIKEYQNKLNSLQNQYDNICKLILNNGDCANV